MSDLDYPLFPVFAFIGFFLVLIPLPWHFQAWNAGTCLYMIWTALACLNQFVNSIVWHDNALNPAPIWCDISIKLIVGVSVAIPAASLCINRRLYKIATVQVVSVSRKQKIRAIMEDLAIGLGIPVLQMILVYIVSGHRFNIYGEIGCYPDLYNTWLTYLLVASWPIALGLVSAVYCILTIRAFLKRGKEFNEFLAHNSSLTVHRYLRLMALASTELLCTTPFAIYSTYLNLTAEPVQPYKGWADLHFDYSRVDQFPAFLWQTNHLLVVSLQLSRWMLVVCAFVFFAFFGFAAEARKHYKMAFWVIVKRFGIEPRSAPFSGNNVGVLPVFVPRPPRFPKRDSLGSIVGDDGKPSTLAALSEPCEVKLDGERSEDEESSVGTAL